MLDLDVVADFEVRHGEGLLAADGLRLEHGSVRLDHAKMQNETRRRRLLRLLADGLLRLDTEDLMLEHFARGVGVNPERRVVEDARGVAVHVMTRLLPRLELADHGAAVAAVRLEIRGPFEEIDRGAKLRRFRAHLQRFGERVTERCEISSRIGGVGQVKARGRIVRVLGERARQLLGRGLRIPRAREDIGHADGDVFPLRAALRKST